jgi:hypothetical protein
MEVTLYHGSISRVEHVDLRLANPRRDFGAGFYTTTSLEQAVRFCRIVARRAGVDEGIVSRFSLPSTDGLTTRRFVRPDGQWLDFVLLNRVYGSDAQMAHLLSVPDAGDDLIIGPVADDQVGRTLNLLVTGAYGDPRSSKAKGFALSLLQTEKLTDQWVLKTDKAVERLAFLGADSYGK